MRNLSLTIASQALFAIWVECCSFSLLRLLNRPSSSKPACSPRVDAVSHTYSLCTCLSPGDTNMLLPHTLWYILCSRCAQTVLALPPPPLWASGSVAASDINPLSCRLYLQSSGNVLQPLPCTTESQWL